jgi:hypothetical protein
MVAWAAVSGRRRWRVGDLGIDSARIAPQEQLPPPRDERRRLRLSQARQLGIRRRRSVVVVVQPN